MKRPVITHIFDRESFEPLCHVHDAVNFICIEAAPLIRPTLICSDCLRQSKQHQKLSA